MNEFFGAPEFLANLAAEHYSYNLPPERIAERPLSDRESSRLLRVRRRTATLSHHRFSELAELLAPGALLVRNETRVIAARLAARKPSGGAAEILLLAPVQPSTDPALSLAACGACQWQCLLGGRRIAEGDVLFVHPAGAGYRLEAHIEARNGGEARVRFTWEPADLPFGHILEHLGSTPLPPYIKRSATPEDRERYQTVYARCDGSAAAPTAGLHFSPAVLAGLAERSIATVNLTLHVGAGTFAPIKSRRIAEHSMHAEQFHVERAALEKLLAQAAARTQDANNTFVAVGTTSVRTLESLYALGALLRQGVYSGPQGSALRLEQWDAYRPEVLGGGVSAVAALEALLEYMQAHGLERCSGSTRLMIAPGYRFAMCDALITNFHQPGSTLLLLVAAFLGRDLWQEAYRAALDKGYRFLSYGDSSLLD